jgi:hypothetical protein
MDILTSFKVQDYWKAASKKEDAQRIEDSWSEKSLNAHRF